MYGLTRPLKIAAGALVLGLAVATPMTAHAAVAHDALQKTVRYGDLDLDRREGAIALYRQIESAAREVCGSAVIPGTHLKSEAWQSCVGDAIRHAVDDVDRRELSAYYVERGGAPKSATTSPR